MPPQLRRNTSIEVYDRIDTRLNSDPNGRSQEKGMSFSSPIFLFLGF